MKRILSRVGGNAPLRNKGILTGFTFLLFLLLFPSSALGAVLGDVIINEVMWAGGDNEWIELYNNTDGNVDITGWKIDNALSSNGNCDLGGIIPPKTYFLISSRLSNADFKGCSISLTDNYQKNGVLILKDKEKKLIDQTPSPSGGDWPVGENGAGDKDFSMERINPTVLGEENCDWKTSQNSGGTPKAKNSQYSDIDCRILEADAGPEIFSITGKDITFDASGSKGLIEKYTWNFGDGKTGEGKIVSHKYEKSGEYIVSLFIASGSKESRDVAKVTVFPGSIFISEFSPKQRWLEISNEGGFIEDISGFNVSDKNEKGTGFVLPDNSFIASNGVLFISSDLLSGLSFGSQSSLFLFYPSGDIKQEIKYTLPAGVDDNWSISRKGSDYFYTKTKTPGKQNLLSGENKESSSGSSSSVSATEPQEVSRKVPQETRETQKTPPARRIFSSNLLAEIGKDKVVLTLSGLGVACFSGFLGLNLVKLRRKMKRNWRQVTGNLQLYNSQQTIGGKQEKEIIELEIEH